jgi:DNA modification methylase
MRWLIEIVTREGDTVLDPLCGSGSTGCAATWVGREFIGIEKEAEYHAIAEARVAWWANQRGKEYDDMKAQWDADNGEYPLFGDTL